MVTTGNKVIINKIANVTQLQCSVRENCTEQNITAAVVHNLQLFVFLLDDQWIPSKRKTFDVVKPHY